MTRRSFTAATSLAALQAQTAPAPMTAQQVIAMMRKAVGAWREPTVDTIKAGSPDTAVRGIATTVMATLDVLQRAAAQGLNLVITHEPTFYNHEDKTEGFEADPVFLAKQALIAKHNMVVFRFHDNWHAFQPDRVLSGLAGVLGFARSAAHPRLFEVPPTPLAEVARGIRSRLKSHTMRVVGKPDMPVSLIALNPGYASLMGPVRGLREADLYICGEAREWEGVEYAFDAVAAGQRKALILLGHAISEDPGMDECAKWLKGLLPGLPVDFLPAGDPFWQP